MKIMSSRKQEMSNFSFCLQFLSCINANSCCTIFGKLISPTYRCNVFRYMIIIFLFVIIFLIFIFVNLYFSIVSSYIFIQVKMCIDRLPVAIDAQLIASSLFGWLVDLFKTAKKMHFSKFWDSQQNGKSNSADPRVNTIKSPQSNPDISNGQLKTHLLRRFWGEYFWTALAASKFDGVITPECPEFLDTLVSTSSAVDGMKVIFSRLATYFVNWYLQTRSINITRFFEINYKSANTHPRWNLLWNEWQISVHSSSLENFLEMNENSSNIHPCRNISEAKSATRECSANLIFCAWSPSLPRENEWKTRTLILLTMKKAYLLWGYTHL